MNILALDIGTRRTGVAYADTDVGVPLALDTIHHASPQELIDKVLLLVEERGVKKIAVGLPLLLSGKEGSQAGYVRGVVDVLRKNGLSVELVDERYTTPKVNKSDGDAAAACSILSLYLDRKND